MVIGALRRDDNTGKKTKILLEYHQLESGGRRSFIEKEFDRLQCLTQTWVVTVVRNLRTVGLQLVADHWKPRMDGGQTIMERIAECGIRGEEWEKCNLCRMSLGLIYVDDLYTLQ